jgi:hypothetical protein
VRYELGFYIPEDGILHNLGVSVQNFKQLDGRVEILNYFICSYVFGLVRICDDSDSECASDFGHISENCDGGPRNG